MWLRGLWTRFWPKWRFFLLARPAAVTVVEHWTFSFISARSTVTPPPDVFLVPRRGSGTEQVLAQHAEWYKICITLEDIRLLLLRGVGKGPHCRTPVMLSASQGWGEGGRHNMVTPISPIHTNCTSWDAELLRGQWTAQLPERCEACIWQVSSFCFTMTKRVSANRNCVAGLWHCTDSFHDVNGRAEVSQDEESGPSVSY